MPVSKRLRFEILRRDNHACRYCGRAAPEVVLTVDHVVPVTLGGSDEPANLVAACKDCNSGKSSVPAEAEIVADVASDALRWADAMRRACEMALSELAVLESRRESFHDAWNAWHWTSRKWSREEGSYIETQMPIPLEAGWEQTIDRFYAAGLVGDQLGECIRIAMAAKVPHDRTWRYFCGIAWNRIRQLQEIAAQLLAADEQAPKTALGFGE